jgi:hypothetical protein
MLPAEDETEFMQKIEAIENVICKKLSVKKNADYYTVCEQLEFSVIWLFDLYFYSNGTMEICTRYHPFISVGRIIYFLCRKDVREVIDQSVSNITKRSRVANEQLLTISARCSFCANDFLYYNKMIKNYECVCIECTPFAKNIIKNILSDYATEDVIHTIELFL